MCDDILWRGKKILINLIRERERREICSFSLKHAEAGRRNLRCVLHQLGCFRRGRCGGRWKAIGLFQSGSSRSLVGWMQWPTSFQSAEWAKEAEFCFLGFGKMVNPSSCRVLQWKIPKSPFPHQSPLLGRRSSPSLACPRRKNPVLLSRTLFIPHIVFSPPLHTCFNQSLGIQQGCLATTCKCKAPLSILLWFQYPPPLSPHFFPHTKQARQNKHQFP